MKTSARTRRWASLALVHAFALLHGRDLEAQAHFLRGDANHDTAIDISDPIRVLDFLFGGGSFPPCMDAADGDDKRTRRTPRSASSPLGTGRSPWKTPFREPAWRLNAQTVTVPGRQAR